MKYGYKPRPKPECKHTPDPSRPTAKTPSGHTIAICYKCGKGYDVGLQEEKTKIELEKLRQNAGLPFEDAVRFAELDAKKKRFIRNKWFNKKKPSPKPHHDF